MHLPRVSALPTLILVSIGIWFLALGCAEEGVPPSVPRGVSVNDLPADDGTNVIVSWLHYQASSARQYDIYYSISRDSLENEELLEELTPINRTVQVAVPVVEDSSEITVCDLNYYLILEEEDGRLPKARIVRATPENEDSLAAVGEKILCAEREVAPADIDGRELKFARGSYYHIDPPVGDPKPSVRMMENSGLEFSDSAFTVVEEPGQLLFSAGLSRREMEFRTAGERIEPFNPEFSTYFIKYGGEISSIVTEDTRYALATNQIKSVIRENLTPDKEHYCKIVALNEQGDKVSTEIKEFTPVDEPPMPAARASALLDTAAGKALFNWTGYNPGLAAFRDVLRYEIHRYQSGDTLMESGELLATFGADHGTEILDGDFSPEDSFYIVSFDHEGQRSTSPPFGMTAGELSPPDQVENLQVVDAENDDGSELSIRWGQPKIDLEFTVTDPSPEYEETELPDNYYLIQSGGKLKLAYFEPEDTTLPPDAMPAHSVQEWVRPDSFQVQVRYQAYTHDGQPAPYARLIVNGGGEELEDFKGVGSFTFERMAAGEHTFKATLLKSSGADYENPQATIEKTVAFDAPGQIRSQDPPQFVEVWRGNVPITNRKGDTLFGGPPLFEKDNPNTFEKVGKVGIMAKQVRNAWPDSLRDRGRYYYAVRTFSPDGSYRESEIIGPKTPQSQLFNAEKAMVLVFLVLFVAFVNFFLSAARKGKDFYLRPIAGIQHIDEALGRATEMGRPLLYVLGLTGISDVATLAGLTILGRVAKKAAEFQTRLIVPCYNPIVLIVAQETVKTACMDAGRPDAYNEDDVFYAAGSQFSYAAAVAGLMVRYKTAANFYMGMFFAESLILTETGSLSGSIQIAGTDAVTQIPFFITTCDYTLIGEELYAASAYLSQDPLQVGTLKAQDALKVIYMAVIVLGTVAMTSGLMWFVDLFKIRLEQ